MVRISLEEMSLRLKQRFPDDDLELVQHEAVSKPCSIKCKRCNTIYHHKSVDSLMRSRRLPYYCHNCSDTPEWIKTKQIFLD